MLLVTVATDTATSFSTGPCAHDNALREQRTHSDDGRYRLADDEMDPVTQRHHRGIARPRLVPPVVRQPDQISERVATIRGVTDARAGSRQLPRITGDEGGRVVPRRHHVTARSSNRSLGLPAEDILGRTGRIDVRSGSKRLERHDDAPSRPDVVRGA